MIRIAVGVFSLALLAGCSSSRVDKNRSVVSKDPNCARFEFIENNQIRCYNSAGKFTEDRPVIANKAPPLTEAQQRELMRKYEAEVAQQRFLDKQQRLMQAQQNAADAQAITQMNQMIMQNQMKTTRCFRTGWSTTCNTY